MDSSAYIFYELIYRLLIYIQSANKISQKSIENAQLMIRSFQIFLFSKIANFSFIEKLLMRNTSQTQAA